MSQKRFHLTTISNDLDAYKAMRDSMAKVGFTEGTCRFTLLNNSQDNRHDPYETLRQLSTDGDEPYFILCHQDLLFNSATSYEALVSNVDQLNRLDKHWAICGVAGISPYGERLLHLDDPNGSFRVPNLPRVVTTLDENFLLVRRKNAVAVSPGLSGFHFYGADLCLNAMVHRLKSYVIDFPVIHLSRGVGSPSYHAGREALKESWKPRLWVGLINTTSTHFHVSSNAFFQRLLNRAEVRAWFQKKGLGFIPRWGIGNASTKSRKAMTNATTSKALVDQ